MSTFEIIADVDTGVSAGDDVDTGVSSASVSDDTGVSTGVQIGLVSCLKYIEFKFSKFQ